MLAKTSLSHLNQTGSTLECLYIAALDGTYFLTASDTIKVNNTVVASNIHFCMHYIHLLCVQWIGVVQNPDGFTEWSVRVWVPG